MVLIVWVVTVYFQDHSEVFETVQLLGQSVSRLYSVANQANDRCVKLTNGCCYVSLLQALKVSTYLSMLFRINFVL